MPTVLIIGASRGIGHELARQYLSEDWRVIASARKPADLAELDALGAEPHLLDVNDGEQISALGALLANERLDVVILNAGVYGPRDDGFPSTEDFDLVMHTNVLSAMRLLPLLAPLCAPQAGGPRGKLAVISSRMGSLSMRGNGSGTLYRASKAALNSVLLDTSLTFGTKGATCVAFHPGWVRTDMGGKDADISVEQSAYGLRHTIANLSHADNGKFLNYDGSRIGW